MIRIWSVWLFLLVALSASAKQCKLIPDISGSECCENENTLSCLKNMLASINEDEGFYSTISIDKIHQLKAEYNIQIAWLYYNDNDFVSSLRYVNEALMHSETSTEYNKTQANFRLQSIVLTHGKLACEELGAEDWKKCHCEEYGKKLDRLEETEMTVFYTRQLKNLEEEKVVQNTADTITNNNLGIAGELNTIEAEEELEANNQILVALRKHIRNNPPSDYLGGTSIIDTTILRIDHYLRNGKYVKECLLVNSNHPREVGEHLMALANELNFERIKSNISIETTIVVHPGTLNGCEYRDGVYHVYYKSQDYVQQH